MVELAFDVGYVRRLSAGDCEARDHFCHFFEPLVKAWLSKRVRSPQLRQDVSQDTFARILAFLNGGGELEHPERLPAFVFAVARNTLREKIREHQRGAEVTLAAVPIPADSAPVVEAVMISEERFRRVRHCLSCLPEPDRGLIRKVFLDGACREAVCREFGVDRDYLRVRLHRAVNRLREEIGREAHFS